MIKKCSRQTAGSIDIYRRLGYNTGTKVVEIPGYLGRVPERQTAASFFDAIMADWMTTTQTPQNNTTVLEIYIIP